jgi:hypothetical protein
MNSLETNQDLAPLICLANRVRTTHSIGVFFTLAIASLAGCGSPSNQTAEQATQGADGNTRTQSVSSTVTSDAGPKLERPKSKENIKTSAVKSIVASELDASQEWASARLSDLEFKIERHWDDAIRIDCIWRYSAFIAKFQNSSEPIARHWVTRAQRYRDDLLPFASADSTREETCKTMEIDWNKPLDRQAISGDGINIKFDEFGYPRTSNFYVASLEWLEASAYDNSTGIIPFLEKYRQIENNPTSPDEIRTAAREVLDFEQSTLEARASLLARRGKKEGP